MRAVACIFFVAAASLIGAATADAAPVLGPSEWRTGELEVCYTNATPGALIKLYVATDKSDGAYTVRDVWIADNSAGCYITKYFENGQTVWHYITETVNGVESEPSNEGRQTPPITAYIINWPEMLQDIIDAINAANDRLIQALNALFTPSQGAMDNVKDAVDDLKNSVGAGAAEGAGGGLQSGFDDVKTGLKPPVVTDDGNGTWTGGAHPDELPPLQGTMNELSWCVTITKDMQGRDFKACLFTQEQLEKMKWWDVVRKAIGFTIYITFGVWLVTRFTPQFKV